jgi:hypothetical protein
MIDSLDPLLGIPFRGDYGWRRMLNTSQWRQRYRGMALMYPWVAYRCHNPFFVEPYVDEQGVQQ